MEDRNALDAQDVAAGWGLGQSLPPTSILRGLPAPERLYATHPVGASSFGSWGWLQLMSSGAGDIAALRLCTYPQYGQIKPAGVYLVEVLASLERLPVPDELVSMVQAAICLGEAMTETEKVRPPDLPTPAHSCPLLQSDESSTTTRAGGCGIQHSSSRASGAQIH